MPKFEVEITAILPKTAKSSKLKATIEAKDVPLAIAKMIDGIFADKRRVGTTIWYRDFKNRAYPRGYHKTEKGILIAAVREDAAEYPDAMAFPPNFKIPRIVVRKIEEKPLPPPPPKPKKPEQLTLFAFGTTYVSADDISVPDTLLDKAEIDELVEESEEQSKRQQTPAYAMFYRILSDKGLNAFLSFRPKSDDPEEEDSNQALLKSLREADAWILSDGGPVSKIPVTAVKGEINVSDLGGGSQRKIEAYVDGDVAYAGVDKAFVGAPPVLTQPPAGG